MKRRLTTIVLGICIFIVYLFGLTAIMNVLFSFPNATAVLIGTIIGILISLIITIVTIRRVEYAYTHHTPDKKSINMLLIAVLFVVYLFGIQSIFQSVLPLENPFVNIGASIVWFGLSIGLAVVTRKKIEEWYQSE